jgi:hypothetical protein
LFLLITRTGADVLRMIVDEGEIRRQRVSCFVQALVKCTKMHFFEANDAPFFLAYFR